MHAAIWAGRFDEKCTDVLSLEDAIAGQVAEAIIPHLTGDERSRLARRSTEDPQAHEAYMRGRFHWNSMTESGFAQSLIYFNRAVAIDPNYALAYAGIADYYNFLGIYAVLPFRECAAAAKEAALRAAVIDATLAEGYSALAVATLCHDFEWETAEQLHRRALDLNPNYANGHVWFSYHLAMCGRFDDAIAECRKAIELDPVSPLTHHTLAWNLYHARRYDESISATRRLLSIDPSYGLGHLLLGTRLRYAGAPKEAQSPEQKAFELMGRTPFLLTFLSSGFASTGDTQKAWQLLLEVEEISKSRYVSPYLKGLALCDLGETGRSLDELERALEIGDSWLCWLAVEPRFDRLRNQERFKRVLKKTANPLAIQREREAVTDTSLLIQNGASAEATDQENGDTDVSSTEKAARHEEARQLYVAGRYYATKRTAEGFRQAIERLEHAVELDPNLAIAYAELADCYSLLNWYIEPPPAGAFEHARRAAMSAVLADPNLADGHAALGFVKLHYERDWTGAEHEFQRAIELKPGNTTAHRWYAACLSAMARHEEAVAEMIRAKEISPQSAVNATAVANAMFLARRFDDAIRQCRAALELDPGSVAAYVVLRWSYERLGKHREAMAAFEQERVFAGETPTTRAKHAHVLAACGNRSEARELLQDILTKREEQWITAYEVAVIYALFEDNDNALLWLARAEREHAVGFTFVRVDPHLDNLRSDSRFAQMIRRIDDSTG